MGVSFLKKDLKHVSVPQKGKNIQREEKRSREFFMDKLPKKTGRRWGL